VADDAATSPLGRYDEGGDVDEPESEVRLIGVPVQVLADARQHHDELMREFALMSLVEHEPTAVGAQQPPDRADVPARLLELVEVLGVRYGRTAARPDEAVDAAIGRGDLTLDVTYVVPAHVVDAADQLESLMAEADEFCHSEQLLTLERSDLQRRFATWYLSEFRRQLAGEPAQPWDGPLSP
jgi:hypothetical protein